MPEEFTPITTQEAFDAAINERLEQARSEVRKEFADYETMKSDLETLRGQITQKDGAIAGLNAKMTKILVAHELGLPMELHTRLNGEKEEDIRKDAAALVKFIGQRKNAAPPLASTEPATVDKNKAAFKGLLEKLKED